MNVNHGCHYMSRTEFLAASFFDTFYIQCIFYYKLRSHLGSIIKYLFHRGPPPPPPPPPAVTMVYCLIYTQSNNLDQEFKR